MELINSSFIDVYCIDEFKNHPFKVVNDDDLVELKESILKNGITNPLLVRKKDNNRFELISGHRRLYVAKLLGLDKVPALEVDMDDEEAIVTMVDSNIHRKCITVSERAFSLKMKYEALSIRAGRSKHGKDYDILVSDSAQFRKEFAGSYTNTMRYISLTNLISEILDLIDNKKISFVSGCKLASLSKEEQNIFLDACCITKNEAAGLNVIDIDMIIPDIEVLDEDEVSFLIDKKKDLSKDRPNN